VVSRPTLTVVVCCHNGATKLPIALTSLSRQTLEPDRFEVLVVDDGSSDGTAGVAAEMGARTLRLLSNAGLAASRNAGVAAARGEIVAFTDDDCEADPMWLATVLSAFERDRTIDGVGGRVVPQSANGFVRRFLSTNNPLLPLGSELLRSARLDFRLRLYIRRALQGHGAPPTTLYSVVGANMAFRRRLIVELGGFDEQFRFGSEEEELCLRAHRRAGGARLLYLPDAVVTHWFDERVGDSIRRSRAYGRGVARRFLKHRDTRPIAYPVPALIATLLLAGVVGRRARLLIFAALAPAGAYPRWLAAVRRLRSAEPLVYPYLQLAQEAATMIGELDGLRRGYEPVPSRYLSLTLTETAQPELLDAAPAS